MNNNVLINKRKTFRISSRRIPYKLRCYGKVMKALTSDKDTKGDTKLISFVSTLLQKRFKIGIAVEEPEGERKNK